MTSIKDDTLVEPADAIALESMAPTPANIPATVDEADPLAWPTFQKWVVTGALSASSFNRIMVSTIMAPALSTIGKDLDLSTTESVMALSIYALAGAFSPLLFGPLSEVFGRTPMMHITNVWFLAFNIACGFAHNSQTLLAGRFLAGFAGGAVFPLAAGVMGDLWPPEQRGVSMSLYMLIPLLGAAVGPIVGGFVEQYSSWRWIFWSTSIFQFFSVSICFLCLRETHLPTILKRQERKRGPPMSRMARIKADLFSPASRKLIGERLATPFQQLALHRSVQMQALLSGFAYGLLYLVLSSFSSLFTDQYNQSVAISGLHYIAPCLGEVVGSLVGGRALDAIVRRLKRHRHSDVFEPEFYLPIIGPATILAGAGLLLYGFAAQGHLAWIVVDIGAFIELAAIQVVSQALQAYNMDSYPETRASTSAAVQIFRGFGAFAMPLAGPAMYKKLGYGWGNMLMAGIFVAGNLSATWALWEYGAKMRLSHR